MAHTLHKYYRGLGKYFVYGHFRLDTCKLFYIGIGTKQANSHYQRAFATANRNPHWKHITNKTNYKVVILFESDNLDKVKAKEVYLISKYKDRLCNISAGGDFPCDKILNKKIVYQYSLDGLFINKYDSLADASRATNISTSTLYNSLSKNKANNSGNFQWFYDYKGEQCSPILKGRSTKKRVRLYNDKEEYIFNSREECAKHINRSPGRVTDLIKLGKFKTYNIENYG